MIHRTNISTQFGCIAYNSHVKQSNKTVKVDTSLQNKDDTNTSKAVWFGCNKPGINTITSLFPEQLYGVGAVLVGSVSTHTLELVIKAPEDQARLVDTSQGPPIGLTCCQPRRNAFKVMFGSSQRLTKESVEVTKLHI